MPYGSETMSKSQGLSCVRQPLLVSTSFAQLDLYIRFAVFAGRRFVYVLPHWDTGLANLVGQGLPISIPGRWFQPDLVVALLPLYGL